jgi:outer membrane biosynthesis protein TonB
MRRSLVISGIAHAIVLGWGLIAFAAKPNEAPQADPLPVEFVSATDFSQLTNGVKNAPKAAEQPKPLADKIGEPKPVKELAPKVADKPEIKTDAAAAAAPDTKPEPKPEPKPVEKAEKPKDPKPKADQIAEELKKDEAKKPQKKPPEFKPDQIAEELKKDEAKKQRSPTKFDANQVAALLDKREPQRQVATAETLSNSAALGAPTGNAAHLSQSELDALRAKLISLWNPPPAISSNPDQYVVTIRIRLTRDHRLVGQPEVLNGGGGVLFEATRDSAVRAVLQAQPYDMLSPATYDQWKEMDINFDPREVFGG